MVPAVTGNMRGPRAKIERAKKEINELEAKIGDLTFANSTHPQVILIEDDPQTAHRLYKLGDLPEIPDHIPALAGNVVHNLRASLDLLFGQLIVANGKEIGEDYFPIAYTRKNFKSRCEGEVKGRVGEDALKLIRATEAYRGGKGDAFWRVHRLDIEDKHRLLFVVGFGFRSFGVPMPTEHFSPEAVALFEGMGLFLMPEDRMVPLKKGDVIFVDQQPAVAKTEVKFRLDVAFNESQIVQGEPLLPTLVGFAEKVEGTVEAFAALFEPI